DALRRKKVDIACFQETKWKGLRTREGNQYKLWYSGSATARNGVGVALAPNLKDKVVQSFWDSLDDLVRECSTTQQLIIAGDLNGDIGANADGFSCMEASAAEAFRSRVIKGVTPKEKGRSVSDAEQMWNTLANTIKEAAKETLRVVEGTLRTRIGRKESWWISEKVQGKVKAKQTRFIELISMRGEDKANRSAAEERYKEAKKEAKKAVARVKEKAYEDLYKRLDSKEGENDIYRIAKARDRKKTNLGNVKFIKDEDERSITFNDKGTPTRYIKVIHDMYEGARTCVRTPTGNTEYFTVDVGLHQGSAISSYLFALILDELTKGIQDSIPWCLIFVDDIVLVSKMPHGLNGRLEQWRKDLEDKGLRVKPKESFRCLGSMMHKSRRIENDVTHRIQVGWLKWRVATGILCDKKVPLKLKGKFYRVAIRLAIMYGSECWPLTKVQANRMEVVEMSMLRPQSATIRRVESLNVDGAKRRGRPKLMWEDRLKTDLKEMLLSKDMTFDRNAWRTRIRVDNGEKVFLEAVALPSGRRVTVYIPPLPYLVFMGLDNVVVVVVAVTWALYLQL
nr:hypothetical protein [Tanacetum cinerariifolium]